MRRIRSRVVCSQKNAPERSIYSSLRPSFRSAALRPLATSAAPPWRPRRCRWIQWAWWAAWRGLPLLTLSAVDSASFVHPPNAISCHGGAPAHKRGCERRLPHLRLATRRARVWIIASQASSGDLGQPRAISGNLGSSRVSSASRRKRCTRSPARRAARRPCRHGEVDQPSLARAGAGNTEALSLASWADMGKYGEIWGDMQHRGALARIPAPYEEPPWRLPSLPISPHLSPYLPICGHSSQTQGPVRASDRRLAVHDRHAPLPASILERVKLRDAP